VCAINRIDKSHFPIFNFRTLYVVTYKMRRGVRILLRTLYVDRFRTFALRILYIPVFGSVITVIMVSCMFYYHCSSHFYISVFLCVLFKFGVRLSYHNKRLLTYLLLLLFTLKSKSRFNLLFLHIYISNIDFPYA